MKSIAHTGTYDVENYGDLLFPLLVKKYLPDFESFQISPRGGGPIWSDCVASAPPEQLLERDFSGIIVGGGNIIHPNRTKLATYRSAGVQQNGYADLWIGAALSVDSDIPVVWNAPGLPSRFAPEFVELVAEALERTDYISVRDEESMRYLKEVCPDCEVSIIPDSAWNLPELWLAGELDNEFDQLVGNAKFQRDRYISIHLNDRYLAGLSVGAIASIVDSLCEATDATPILIAIGRCHDDHVIAQRVAQRMRHRPLLIDQPESLRQVCAAISRSTYYIGSSMHGYITAASFGVPAILVAKKMVKFSGLVRFAGAPQTLVQSWKYVPEVISGIDPAAVARNFRMKQQEASVKLANHWATIAAHFQDTMPTVERPISKEAFTTYRKRFEQAARKRNARRKFPFFGLISTGASE